MKTPWRLRLHGAPCLWPPAPTDAPLLLSRKDAALLAAACLQAPMASARLASWLWPQASAAGALNSLRQRLFRLRKACDARLLEMGETLVQAPDLMLAAAEDPAALAADPRAWDAELLAGFDYPELDEFSAWLAAQRSQHAERRRRALEHLADQAEAAGDLPQALRYAQRRLADDPLSEPAHRRLMRLHYLRGDGAAAVAAFEACEQLLRRELGLRPAAETLALLQQVEAAHRAPAFPAQAAPLSLLRPPRVVGRDIQQAALAQALADGELVVLVGEAGMGKSRLLRDLSATRAGTVYVQARAGDSAVPCALLGRLLQALEEGLQAGGDTEPAPAAAPHAPAPWLPQAWPGALTRLLATAPGPVTLALDDLHFADGASLELLAPLWQAAPASGPHWLLAHRPLEASGEVGQHLQALEDLERVRWIRLGPLTPAQIDALLRDLALPGIDPSALSPALARHSGGNPLFLLETLRALLAGGVAEGQLPRPDTIERLIDRRLRRLSSAAQALMRVAAVAAPDFSPALAEAVLGQPALSLADAWQELEQADVMRGNSFAHDLVLDAALRATPAPIAAHEHGRVAAFLAARGAEPARVARHWQRAQAWPEAAAAFEAAAQRAQAGGRLREQAQLLQAAVECHQAAGDGPGTGRAGAAAVEALLAAQGPDAALACADALLPRLGESEAAARVGVARATAALMAGHAAAAADDARRALSRAGGDAPALQLGATRKLALALAAMGRADEAIEQLEPWCTRPGAQLPDEDWMGLHGDRTHLFLAGGRLPQAALAAEQHLGFARRLGAVHERMSGLMNLSSLQVLRGAVAEAVALAREADGVLTPEDGPLQGFRRWNRIQLGAMLSVLGEYTEAVTLLEEACTQLADEPANAAMRANAQTWLARCFITLGQTARAQPLLAAPLDSVPAQLRVSRLAAQAALATALGRDGLPLLQEAQALAQRIGRSHEQAQLALDMLPYANDAPTRLADATALQQRSETLGLRGVAAAAQVARVDALVALGRGEEARLLLPAAERQAVQWRRAYLPELLHTCARAHEALGQAGDARRCLTTALDWLHGHALPHVPLHWRDGFLHRNPHNRALAAAAARASPEPPRLPSGTH